MREAVRAKVGFWTNASVRLLAGQGDPLEVVQKRAREIVLQAMDQGWSGPPFDPIALSGLLDIPVLPRADIRDARTVPQGESGVCIEYNPTRPRGRLRYSVAHEIAHTLFPDCAERIRNRSAYHELQGDEWQLEVLCNVGAAEFLMPIGSLQSQSVEPLSIDRLLALRSRFDVSTEAILIRTVHVTEGPCSAFVASRIDRGAREGQYRLDYAIPSRSWSIRVPTGLFLSEQSVVQECTAIGYTAKGDEVLPSVNEKVHLECVGIPPYPGCFYPRVAGLMTGTPASAASPEITYLKGNALEPRGEAQKIIVHVVNDATPNWGGRGFAVGLKQKWPEAQREFRSWAEANRAHLKLGQVHVVRVSDDVSIASMVCQKGYGPSAKPRIRYAALEECLSKVAEVAGRIQAAVHMPRIACGQAGGAWFIVEELISSALLGSGVPAFVYDLTEREPIRPIQAALSPSMA
ncbi:MAG: ImmA/IrrE family metallo-endopeptidase [Planctomycetota bacterium]